MAQYLIAIRHPDNSDPSAEGEAIGRDNDVLNEEMEAAGVSPVVNKELMNRWPRG